MIDLFDSYLRQQQDLSANTLRAYLADLRSFITWYESWSQLPYSIDEIATPTITAWRAEMQTDERAPATINRRLVSVKRYFAWAVEAGHLQRDPARVVKQVDKVPAPPRELSDRDEAALMAAVERYGTQRDLVMITVLLMTGLRASELLALRQSDVEIKPRSGSVLVRAGKGNKQRSVPLNITARKALQEYMHDVGSWVYVFPGRADGKPLEARTLGYIVEKYGGFARIEHISPHDLRHRFGYRMAKTTPLHVLADLMGHSDINTTRIYTKATQADLQKAVEAIRWE